VSWRHGVRDGRLWGAFWVRWPLLLQLRHLTVPPQKRQFENSRENPHLVLVLARSIGMSIRTYCLVLCFYLGTFADEARVDADHTVVAIVACCADVGQAVDDVQQMVTFDAVTSDADLELEGLFGAMSAGFASLVAQMPRQTSDAAMHEQPNQDRIYSH
jgi:hypothetical protein